MTIRNPITELIFRAIRTELPHRESMDEYLDYILPYVRRFTEHLHEQEFYLEKRWMEVRDEDNFHEVVLHIFKPEQNPVEIKVKDEDQGSPYLLSVNGNIIKGTWSFLKSGGLIVKHLQRYELYDLAFLSDDFFILRKHGDQAGRRKYLFLGNDRLVKNLDWRECMELLYDIYRYNLSFLFMFLLVVLLVGSVLIVSLT